MFTKRPAAGIALSLCCLLNLGLLPIISDGRPTQINALVFAFFLSLWELICSLPAFTRERGLRRRARLRDSRPQRASGRWTTPLVVLTGVLFGLATYLYVYGVERSGPVSFAIALQAYPLFAILWETLFLGRSKQPRELVFTAAMLGALFVLGTGGTGRIDEISIWYLVSLGVPFLWSVAHVTLKELLDTEHVTPNQIVFSRLLVSTLFLGAVLLVSGGPSSATGAATNRDMQAFAMLMGAVYYLELFSWFRAVKHIDVSLASSITTPAPVVTMLFAVLFLGDTVARYQVIATAIVVISVFGLIFAASHKRPNVSIAPVERAPEAA